MGPISGWHRGERAIQRKMGFAEVMTQAWTWIKPEMAEEHQVFYTQRLPFIPVTTIDDRHRPWSSILAGPDGQPGFATSRHQGELTFNASIWEGDPFPQNAQVAASKEGPVLIAGIGVEFSTRRRNKFAGYIKSLEKDGLILRIQSVVDEAIGNCPKYINVRDLIPFPDTHPRVVYQRPDLSLDERLPEDVISFIHGSDTLFLGSFYDASENAGRFPSHVGMNQRGGRPGFARIQPSDGRTLVIPDYSGNRLLTSLGNIEATPLAGVTFVSFITGTVLYLTGDAHNIVGPAAQRLMPRVNTLTTIHVTGYILVEDALPVRQRPGTQVQRSPYSPPVRPLAEEITSTYFSSVEDGAQEAPKVTLTQIKMHSRDIASFTFESAIQTQAQHVGVVPGQVAILDFKSLVGALPYQHMAPGDPTSVNDDRIRTWTVSGSNRWANSSLSSEDTETVVDGPPLSFTLTMRHKPGGAVTGALFAIAHKLVEVRPELLDDARPLQFNVPLVGIAGDFTLPACADRCSPGHGQGQGLESPAPGGARKWLWAAGGIGITPFLAMLAGLKEQKRNGVGEDDAGDIILLLSTREPDVLIPLVFHALEYTGAENEHHKGKLSIHVFSRSPLSSELSSRGSGMALTVEVIPHKGRVNSDTCRELFDAGDIRRRKTYVCGPEGFEQAVLAGLKEMGMDSRNVKREGFVY